MSSPIFAVVLINELVQKHRSNIKYFFVSIAILYYMIFNLVSHFYTQYNLLHRPLLFHIYSKLATDQIFFERGSTRSLTRAIA
jgi:hypothetical protein